MHDTIKTVSPCLFIQILAFMLSVGRSTQQPCSKSAKEHSMFHEINFKKCSCKINRGKRMVCKANRESEVEMSVCNGAM